MCTELNVIKKQSRLKGNIGKWFFQGLHDSLYSNVPVIHLLRTQNKNLQSSDTTAHIRPYFLITTGLGRLLLDAFNIFIM